MEFALDEAAVAAAIGPGGHGQPQERHCPDVLVQLALVGMASTVVDGVTAAAQAEPGARRTSLRKIADVFAGGGRDIAVGVVTKAIEHKYGIG